MPYSFGMGVNKLGDSSVVRYESVVVWQWWDLGELGG